LTTWKDIIAKVLNEVKAARRREVALLRKVWPAPAPSEAWAQPKPQGEQ
jgi:hypothetical protein